MQSNKLLAIQNILDMSGVDAIICCNPSDVFYFSNYLCAANLPSASVVSRYERYVVAPSGAKADDNFKVLNYECFCSDYFRNPLDEMIKLVIEISNYKKVGFAAEGFPGILHQMLFERGIELIDITQHVRNLQLIKYDFEVNAIKEALRLNEHAYDAIKKNVCEGSSETDVYFYVARAFFQIAGVPLDFVHDIVSGERAKDIGGCASSRLLKQGDTLIADLLPKNKGYWCDTTRTFFIGKPSKEMMIAYSALEKALIEGERLLRPGISCLELYRSVLNSLEQEGFSGMMPHHAGHGIGVTSYERPYFLKCEYEQLKPGMVVTIEPGIYNSQFGMRIENNYLITCDGFEKLFNYPLDIDYFILD